MATCLVAARAATDANAEVAAALFAASATQAALTKSLDAKLRAQARQIAALKSEVQAGRAHAADLAAAEEKLVGQLAAQDDAYAEAIARFRQDAAGIAATPAGVAALARFNAGDEAGALATLDRLRAALDQAHPGDPIERAAETRRIARLALDARDRGKIGTADVIARYEEVTRLDPDHHWDWVELARLYADAGRQADRVRAAREAARTAADDRDRSVATNETGDAAMAQGDLPGARRAYEDSLAARRRAVAGDPADADAQRDLSVSLTRLGEVLLAQGDLVGARALAEESLALSRRLAESDPDDADLQRDVPVVIEKLGDVLLAQHDLAGARRRYEESLAIRRRLSAADPGNAVAQRDILVSLQKIGDVLVVQHDPAGARVRYAEDLAISRRLATADPGNIVLQRDLCNVLYALADLPGGGVGWREVLTAMEAADRRGAFKPSERHYLDEVRVKAGAE